MKLFFFFLEGTKIEDLRWPRSWGRKTLVSSLKQKKTIITSLNLLFESRERERIDAINPRRSKVLDGHVVVSGGKQTADICLISLQSFKAVIARRYFFT